MRESIIREFGGSAANTQGEAQTAHLKLRWRASNTAARTGQRVTLIVEAELADGMHVYAPGVEGGYIPLRWELASSGGWLVHPASFPASEWLHLPAIGETVPVYQGRFHILCDISMGLGDEVRPFVNPRGEVAVEGTFRYQACDDKVCYPPTTVPLRWVFQLQEHDRTRPPNSLRHPDPDPGG